MEQRAEAPSTNLYEGLHPLIPSYAEHRERWPLWTYDRSAWTAEDAPWIDRLRYSPGYLLTELASLATDQDFPYAGETPPTLLQRAYMYALALQTGETVPPRGLLAGDVSNLLERLQSWRDRNEWLEPADIDAFLEGLRDVLFQRDDGGLSVLSEFATYTVRAAHGSGVGETNREEGRRLAERLCIKAGLLPARRGRTTGLPRPTILRLDREAREIVAELRAAVSRLEDVEDRQPLYARALLESDPSLREKTLAAERRRRRSEESVEVRSLELWLQLPVLRWHEIHHVLTSEDATPERLAHDLVSGRLWGSMAYETYRNELSRARQETTSTD